MPRPGSLAALAASAVALLACGHAPARRPAAPALAQLPTLTLATVAVPEHAGPRQRAGAAPVHHASGDPRAVDHLLRAGQRGFERCFRAARAADPSLAAARVPVRLRIDARGVVASAAPTAGDPALGACLARRLRAVRVPRALAPTELELSIVLAAPSA